MTVYLLTPRGRLHKGTATAQGVQTYERDNLDQTETTRYDDLALVPPQEIKALCERCFPEGEDEGL